MKTHASRREFLQTGLALPAAVFAASRPVDSPQKQPSGVVYRTLGKTGLKVSAVGCGVGLIPDPAVLIRAVELGVNYFDTGRMYENGKSEEITGATLKDVRKRIILASKTDARTKADVFKDIDQSLKALQTDYLDIWHLHSRDTPETITDEAVEACETLKKQGKARFIGVSAHDINAVVDRIVQIGKFDVVQTTYSYAIGSHFRDAAIRKLYEAGIGVVAMKVIIAIAGFIPPKDFRLKGEGPLAAIKWVLMNPRIATTVPFAKNTSELEMNFRAMSEPYTPQDEKMLYVRNEEVRPTYCRMCYACKGKCPRGVPVTDELRCLAYGDFAGDFRRARAGFERLALGIRAIRCVDCPTCVIECPNGVRVRERLIRAQAILT